MSVLSLQKFLCELIERSTRPSDQPVTLPIGLVDLFKILPIRSIQMQQSVVLIRRRGSHEH